MLDALFDWLVDGAPGATTAEDIARRLGEDLAASELPVDRFGVFIRTLHPNVLGRAFIWERGAHFRVGELAPEVLASAAYRDSPTTWCVEHQQELRWRAGESDQGFEVVAELAAAGYVEYVVLPLPFTSGEFHSITAASRTGFSEDHLAALRHVARPLARVAEIYALRRTASNILATYVGPQSGERVLAGRILRGDVDTIRAAIWFSDLRGFTELSSRTAPADVIAILNDVFDCQVPAIEANGGEVLKFIGDGLLAIFPITAAAPAPVRCAAALEAARRSFEALDALDRRTGRSHRIGLALHVGDVAYGNIGGASRLDFTAIGAAVNLAARLEGIANKLGRPMVVSADFAALAGRPFDDLGAFELKGIAAPQHVFGERHAPG